MKKGCGCALLIGLVVLALVAWHPWTPASRATLPRPSVPENPTPTPATSRAALEQIRPLVFHRLYYPSQNAYDPSEQEVTDSPTTAGQGDRVRTPAYGKALLKWPDLHVQIYGGYGGTELETKDVTPNWIHLGILAGTIVTGGKLQPGDRLALSTDYAEITLSGTTVMVAYHPEKDLTIVRVFDGRAEVRNLEGPQQAVQVNAGEWALVEPGGKPPEVFNDPARMQRLARDLGRWDVFHEVEVDVANGFGPAPVPRQDVAIIFEEQATETPTPSPSAPAPAPTPYITCSPDHTTIAVGACTVLSWDVGNVQAVYLDDERVFGREDHREVCPREPHHFDLQAVTGTGDLWCRMSVDVEDTTPPVIAEVWIEPKVPLCYGDASIAIYARVTDQGRVDKVEAWVAFGSCEFPTAHPMTPMGGDRYRYDIGVIDDHFCFDVRAWDGSGNMAETSDYRHVDCAQPTVPAP